MGSDLTIDICLQVFQQGDHPRRVSFQFFLPFYVPGDQGRVFTHIFGDLSAVITLFLTALDFVLPVSFRRLFMEPSGPPGSIPPPHEDARGLCFRPAGSALIGWDLRRSASHPLDNYDKFRRISPIPIASDVPWREDAGVLWLFILRFKFLARNSGLSNNGLEYTNFDFTMVRDGKSNCPFR